MRPVHPSIEGLKVPDVRDATCADNERMEIFIEKAYSFWLKKPQRTQSIDVFSVLRNVKDLWIQYNFWDTTSQSSIFNQGYELTFKSKIVYNVRFWYSDYSL